MIDFEKIEKFDLKNVYISKFNDLNKSNSKYTSLKIIINNENTNKDYLIDFNINFKQIKKIDIYFNNNVDGFYYNCFFNIFFSFDFIIPNTLLYLNICFAQKYINNFEFDSNIFENLYKIKSLEKLQLTNIIFKDNFILKLLNLK